jgi:hypothetical protein
MLIADDPDVAEAMVVPEPCAEVEAIVSDLHSRRF